MIITPKELKNKIIESNKELILKEVEEINNRLMEISDFNAPFFIYTSVYGYGPHILQEIIDMFQLNGWVVHEDEGNIVFDLKESFKNDVTE